MHGSVGAMGKWDARDYVSWSRYVEKLKAKPLEDVERHYDVKQRALISQGDRIPFENPLALLSGLDCGEVGVLSNCDTPMYINK